MPSVCVAAIPPILATIGMSTAAYTTFSKTSANRLIEAAAIIAVKRLIESKKFYFLLIFWEMKKHLLRFVQVL